MKLDLQPLDLQPVEDELDLQPLDLQEVQDEDHPLITAAKRLAGGIEAGAGMVAGLPSMIAGGVLGANQILAGKGINNAARVLKETQEKNFGFGAFNPITEKGKEYSKTLGHIMELPGELGGKAAESVGLDPYWGSLPAEVLASFAPLKLPKFKGKAEKPAPVAAPDMDKLITEEKALQKPVAPQGRVDINLDEGPNLPKQIEVNKEGQGNVTPNDPGLELAVARYKEANARSEAELQFWRDRAAQMEQEAANIERRKGLRPMHVNEEGTAGRPGELEGLRASTEGISYENVPPDGVIPRSKQDGSLQVPRKGEWVPDENGMPVRQNLPEHVIEEPPMELSSDTPQANEMGLTVQEANGPKLGADQIYGNGPIKSPGGRQGGWINPEILDPAFEKIKELGGLGARFKDMYLKFTGDPVTPKVEAFKRTVNDYGRPIDEPIGHVELQDPGWKNGEYLGQESNMEAQFIKTKGDGQGVKLPEEMYKFINELGSEIYPAHTQTTGGQKIWERFERDGLVEKDGAFKRAVDLYIGDMEYRMPSTFFGAAQGVGAAHVPKAMRIPARQRGALIFDPDKTQPLQSTVLEPITPEHIEKKQELATKALALKLENTPYGQVTTKEQAIAQLPVKDIPKNPVRDAVSSGVAGMVYRNPNNSLLKFGRYVFGKAREAHTEFSTKYITGENGIVKSLRNLDEYESVRVAQFLTKFDEARLEVTDRAIKQYGFNDKEAKAIKSVRTMLDEMYSMGNASLGKQGIENFAYRKGYLPSNFTGAYKTLIFDVDLDGNKKVKYVITEDTKGKHDMALEYYKQKIGAPTDLIVEDGRRGMNTNVKGSNRSFNGYLDLIDTMAQHDTQFAAYKAEVDAHIAHNSHKLWEFNVHEKLKKGVGGADGRKPWQTPEQNAKELFEMLANHGEEGSRYFAYQEALNRVGELTSNPQLKNSHPNSLAYLEKYSAHVAGGNLNHAGAFINSVADFPLELMGLGPNATKGVMKEAQALSTAHMMGFWNPAFLATQLTQAITGGWPEAARIRQATGLAPTDITGAFTHMNIQIPLLSYELKTGKQLQSVSPHMRDAYAYAREQGMNQFSEGHLAKDINENPTYTKVKDAAMIPITLGEKMTRLPVFLWNVDMFHRAGLKGAELHTVAKEATDYAMGNYHPDERPMLYQSLGAAGNLLGPLSTYKHNYIEQLYSTAQNAGKQPAAAATILASMYMFYGIANLPGGDIADKVMQELTGHDTRHYLDKVIQHKPLLDGYLSTTSGLDFASRLSTRNMLPNDATSGVLGAHVSNLLNITSKAVTYAWERNVQNRNEALLAASPAGMRGAVENQVRKDENGFVLDKSGQTKFEEPRTDAEWALRTAGAPRPLRETLEDNSLRSLDLGHKQNEDKIKKTVMTMKAAINLGDMNGFESARQQFQDLGGNAEMLSNAWFENNATQANISAKQRHEGINPSGADAIRKYLDYNQ